MRRKTNNNIDRCYDAGISSDFFFTILKTSANLLSHPLTKCLPLTLRTFNMIFVSLSADRLRGNFESCLAGLKKAGTDSGNILTPVGRTTKR